MRKINPPSIVRDNIETVVNIEQQFLERRTFVDRLVDSIASFSGSLVFVLLHLAVFAFWAVVNLGWLPSVRRFDPYPFPLLSTAVSVEAVVLSTFVLMKQNRMSKRAEERNHLHLQVNLLAEKEITKVLQTLSTICDHLGVQQHKSDPEMLEMSQNTAVNDLAEELREKIADVSE